MCLVAGLDAGGLDGTLAAGVQAARSWTTSPAPAAPARAARTSYGSVRRVLLLVGACGLSEPQCCAEREHKPADCHGADQAQAAVVQAMPILARSQRRRTPRTSPLAPRTWQRASRVAGSCVHSAMERSRRVRLPHLAAECWGFRRPPPAGECDRDRARHVAGGWRYACVGQLIPRPGPPSPTASL